MTRFTPLESDILDALAWDLCDIAPDLAGQFAESLPGSRRNTGSGLFTELIVDRYRPSPLTTPTGRFGTVHAMVGDLPDPVAFQIELREGRLLALHGDILVDAALIDQTSKVYIHIAPTRINTLSIV